MMIFGWSDELLKDAFGCLTTLERRAMELMNKTTHETSCSRTCKRHGFETAGQYLSNRDSAKAKLIEYFNCKGISSVDDLPFPTVGHSVEHTMMTKATTIRKTQIAEG